MVNSMILQGISVKIWGRVLSVVVSIVIFALVLPRVDAAALADCFRHLRPEWLILAFGLFGLDCVLAAMRWHVMLRTVSAVSHPGATIRTVFIGHFFNTLLLGPAVGDFAKSGLYARWYGYDMPRIVAASFLDRTLGGVGHTLFFVLAVGVAMIGGLSDISAKEWPTSRIVTAVLVSIGVIVACALLRRRLSKSSPIAKTLDSFVGGVRRLASSPREALTGILLSFLVQVALSGVLALCLAAVVPHPLPWTRLLWTFPVISVITGVPITIAGAGLREGATLVLLGMYGVAPHDAVAASLLTLMVYLLWAVIGGLLLWQQEREFRSASSAQKEPRTISVVIPVLNEAQSLAKTVQSARALAETTEVIVVDGGSTDATRELAGELNCRVIQSEAGRGKQLRAGAALATGDVVLMLHADTLLPPNAGRAAFDALRDSSVVGGAFWKVFDKPSFLMRGSRWRCATRLFINRRFAGDQAIFVRRDALERIGGVPEMPLMEEFELCRRLRQIGRLALAPATVTTSTRRFEKLGVVRTYLRMGRVTLQYYFGTSASELKTIYDAEKKPVRPG